MTQNVQLPDGTTLQFPDGMSHEDMAAAIKKSFPNGVSARQSQDVDADKLMAQQAALPASQRAAALARMSPIQRAAITAKIKADAAAAMTPQAQAARFQKTQAQNVDSMPWYQKIAAGAGKAVVDTGRGLKQVYDSGLDFVDPRAQTLSGLVTGQKPLSRAQEDMQNIAQSRIQDQALMNTGAGKVGNALGYFAEAVPVGIATGGIGLAAPAGAAARVGTGALVGGTQGYAMPYASTGEHVRNTLTGMGLGAAIPGAGAAGNALIKGAASPEAKALIAQGVKLTPGQMLGGGFKSAEDKLTSLPLVGTAIKNAQRRSLDTFNQATVNRAIKPLGTALPKDTKAGYDAVEAGRNAISGAYDDVLGKMHGTLDSTFMRNVASTFNEVAPKLPDWQQRQLSAVVEHIGKKFGDSGELSGKDIKQLYSKLGTDAKGYLRSPDPDHRNLGTAIVKMQADLKGMLERQNPGELADRLANVDKAHAQMVRVEDAASSLGAQEGVFTPTQLRNATRAEDSSYKHRSFSQGNALMQDWADLGRSTLPSTVGDSGTAGRYMLDASVLGGGALTGHGIPLAGLAAGAHALYSRPGSRVAQAFLAPQESPVRNYLARFLDRQLGSPRNALGVSAMLGQQVPNGPVPQQQGGQP